MTFEEAQEIIARMLQIQQDIQIKQINNLDTLARIDEQQEKNSKAIAQINEQQEKNIQAIAILTENVSNLNVVSQRHEDRLTHLYGYQQSADTDRLNIMQGVLDIKRKLAVIEERLNAQ